MLRYTITNTIDIDEYETEQLVKTQSNNQVQFEVRQRKWQSKKWTNIRNNVRFVFTKAEA